MKNSFSLLVSLFLILQFSSAQNLYFPPNSGNTWTTLDPSELNWCTDKLEDLYQFLDEKNSKAFIILKDGKIVVERYFDSFTKDSLW
ncbi:MAG TPA: serine hydrolase, partial [Saprospiraceae bacterium]|nr:serine hydrolase [Saprospiraceae bacterium]